MMFKDKHIHKFNAFALAAVFALALAGCGGGGGTAGEPGTTPTPQEMCVDEKGAGSVVVDGQCYSAEENAHRMCVAGGGRDNEDGTCTPAAELAKIEADTAAAATKRDAIEAEAMGDGAGGIGGTTAHMLDISRDSDGTEIEITVTGATEDDPEFIQDMDMDLGSGLTKHVRRMAADDDGNVVEEVVMVSTDIEAPTPTAFATVQQLDTDTDSENEGNEALEITSENSGNLTANGLTRPADSTGAPVVTYTGGTPAVEANPDASPPVEAADAVPAYSTLATFRGASGVLSCNAGVAGSCSVTYEADGSKTYGSNWVFTPADGATIDVVDSDYLYYGFWLQKTTDADGAVTYNEVQTFAGSSVAESGDLAATNAVVTGTATYTGGAVGVFVREVYKTTDGSVDTATSGHFTADVTLDATFGQENNEQNVGTIAPNLLNTLTGSITDFELSTGEDNDWSVNLSGIITPSAGTAAGTANGGGDPGTFSATFHGPVDADTQPHTVVGEFNANFGNGIAAGAFGARKE